MTIEEFCKPLDDALEEIIKVCKEITRKRKMRMKIEDVIIVLDNANALKSTAQPTLRMYVLNKSIPLETRFTVWMQHCDKRVNRNADIDFVTKMFAAGKVVPFIVLTYNGILAYYQDDNIVKELLIEENFGSIEA